jgi:type 1 glutamine amidotransferase
VTRNLLLSGGPGHDFGALAGSVTALLHEEGIETTVVTDPTEMLCELSGPERAGGDPYDLLTVHALHWGMAAERYAHLRDAEPYTLPPAGASTIGRFVAGGGGLLALHAAVICFDAEPTWHSLCGASWNWATSSHEPVGDVTVTVTDAGRGHDVTAGLEPFSVLDEVYERLDSDPGLVPLLVSETAGRPRPVLWAREFGEGRTVTDVLGHEPASVEHPSHRSILRRAAVWAARKSPGASGPGTTGHPGEWRPTQERRP